MVGVGIVMAVWLAGAISPPATNIEGGTPAQRAQVDAALQKIPMCWRAANGHEPPIVITEKPLWPGDEWNQVEAAYLMKADPTYEKRHDVIWISPAFFDAALSGRPFETSCSGTSRTEDAFQVLSHELAHRMQFQAKSDVVKKFLAIRFRAMHDRVVSDPDYRAAMAKGITQCAAEASMEKALARANVPRRVPGDDYALGANGAEYFAIAIEMMAGSPKDFCRFYSADERAFLALNFGGCLGQFPSTPPCLWEGPAPIRPDGTTTNVGFHH